MPSPIQSHLKLGVMSLDVETAYGLLANARQAQCISPMARDVKPIPIMIS